MTTIDSQILSEPVELRDGGTIDLWSLADDDRITVSAWDQHGDLVGLASFDAHATSHPREMQLEVTPVHRRRGIGTVLFRALVHEAARRGVATLTWTRPADDVTVRHLEAASGGIPTRHVADGRAKTTLYVPAAA